MNTPAAAIDCVTINRSDGVQVKLTADDKVYSPRGPIRVAEIPDALSDPSGWIEYETTVAWEGAEEREPWQESEDPDEHPARARLYARAVVETMVIYGAS